MRRDKRFQVSQSALITQAQHPDIGCEIHDFCQGGLFLKFLDADAAITTLRQRTDSAVEVVFTTGPVNGGQTYRFPAKIKRMSSTGLGVIFERQPVDALRALQKMRMAEHRKRFTALLPTGANPQLREASSTLLNETLLQTYDQLMRALGEKLAAASVQASGISEHTGLLAAMSEFERYTSTVQTGFVQQVLGALKQTRSVHTQPPGGGGEGGLALVDEAAYEDWLATSAEASKLEELFQEQLLEIEPRIGQLWSFSCDHSNNPFGPALIGHAYREAIEDVPVIPRARQVAYATLREILSEQLAAFYAELLALLPVSQAEIADRQPAEDNAQHASVTQADGRPADTGARWETAHPASAAPLSPPKSALGQLTSSLMDFFRGTGSGGGAGSVGTSAPARVSTPAGPVTTGEPAIRSGATQPGMQATGPDSIGAVTVGRADQPMINTIGLANSPVLQRLSAAGVLPAHAAPQVQRSVDMFGALFDTMHAEKSITESIRPFFEQMETSLIKLAMDDPQFLASPAHPAHKVLNTLDRISMAAGDDGHISDARLLRLMRRWTDRINAEADKNPGVFEEARVQLERVVKPLLNERAARVFRLQEMCEGRQRAEVAKQRILAALLSRLENQQVPNAVIELLNGGFRNVLLIAEMRHGIESEEAKAAWEVLDKLCTWLNPDRIDPPTTAEIQGLLQKIDQALTQVSADKFSQDRIVDQLAAALFDENKSQYRYTSVAARLNDSTNEPLSESQDTLVERLRVGDWLQVDSLDAPLNLIWRGDQPHVYVFSHYRGIKKLDLKRADFLQTLEAGGAKWTEDLELPLMDRSYSAMIQKMQRDLMWQSSHDPATGLANRKNFFRAIRRNWLRNLSSGDGYAVGVVQLDIVDPADEPVGETIRTPILREFAQLLPTQLPPNALLARAGESGLSFWLSAAESAEAKCKAEALQQFISEHAPVIEGIRYRIKSAIGLTWATDCLSPEAYYDNANAACTRARESQIPVMLYSSDDEGGIMALAQWAHRLTDILVNDRLSLNCQPVIATGDETRTPLYYEILLHPSANDESVATRELIDIAERLQRITEIDRWVMRTVFQWMREHADRVAALGGLSINLSGQSVTNPLFLKFLLTELATGDLPGEKLIFEISEIDAMDSHAQTQLFMRQLHRHGCRFTLDEFGAGYSSFTRLKSMKLDYLKIDRTLVREVTSSMIDEALVRSILETGSFLGLKTVAGYIENEETRSKLGEMGVDCMQGYLIAEPRPLADL
ncbi:MAG: DUF1631 family protein [Thiobacillus sp.]|nr:DUF1631 family protein [Thiobacillus sp.]